jgi:hypothetical protein
VQYNDPADTNENPADGNPLTFTTPVHAYPWVEFIWCPSEPHTSDTIQFCSNSETGVCETTVTTCQLTPPQPSPADPVACYGGTSCSWSWNLSSVADWTYTSGSDTSENPAGKFASSGWKSVSLTVTDSTPPAQGGPFVCTKSHLVPVEVALPIPSWKEIPPFF